mgnify:CR=1 FL=1
MNYIITAAGLGTRFLKKGIKPPKPLIKVKGIELILWSINSFEFNSKDNLYIVSLKSDNVKKSLEKKISLLYPNINIFWYELDESLNGQLLTSIRAVDFFCIYIDRKIKWRRLGVVRRRETNLAVLLNQIDD